jgi:hypothetical protein
MICHPSEIILANLANLFMCLLKSRGTSAVCTWGLRGIFFQTCIFFVLFSHGAVCCFVAVISPTTEPTLIHFGKTLLCSQEVHALVKKMFGGKQFLDAYFDRSPDKFFSNSEEELEVTYHPEYLNNRKFMQMHKVEYAEKSDQLFNKVRNYFNIHSECTDGVDMVSLKKGTPAYELILRKEKEQAERQKESYAKGEGNFQLTAKTELKKQGIECDDATKAQSILEIVKCSMREGNFQLAAKTELKKRLGWQCRQMCLSATPLKRQTFLSAADMKEMSSRHVGDIL